MKRIVSRLAVVTSVILILSGPAPALAQEFDLPPELLSLNLPNGGGKSIMTPTAWGSAFGVVFAGTSFTVDAPFSENADGVGSIGVGVGDPVLNVGVQVAATVLDLSEFNNVGFSFKLHRYLENGTAIAVGGEHLFADDEQTDFDNETFFVVVSRTFQSVGSGRAGVGGLHASLGVGSGRFSEKSPRDEVEGNGSDGTWVFANLAYEIFQDFNITAEWSGTNLNAGVGWALPIVEFPVVVTLGLADLTDNSGDDIRFVGGAGFAVRF